CPVVGPFAMYTPAACAGPPQPSGQVVDVTLKDFHMDNRTSSVTGGDVVLQVHNEAPATHEFVVVRTDLPADGLPIGPDGFSVNEDWLDRVGEANDLGADTVGTLAVHRDPARY